MKRPDILTELENSNQSSRAISNFYQCVTLTERFTDLADDELIAVGCVDVQDIPEFVTLLRRYGIKRFVNASDYSDEMERCYEFQQVGLKVVGMTKVAYDKPFQDKDKYGIEFTL